MKHRLQRHPNLREWVTLLNPKSGSGRTCASCPFGAVVTRLSPRVYKMKVVEDLSKGYFVGFVLLNFFTAEA